MTQDPSKPGVSGRGVSRRHHLRAARALLPSGRLGRRRAPEPPGPPGFISLTDASPLIIAKERGLSPSTACRTGGAEAGVLGGVRDNLVSGPAAAASTASHILKPAAYLLTTGQATGATPADVHPGPASNLNGQGISVGNDLKAVEGRPRQRRGQGQVRPAQAADNTAKVAMTFRAAPTTWDPLLAGGGGKSSGHDCSMIVITPAQMVEPPQERHQDAFLRGRSPGTARPGSERRSAIRLRDSEIWMNHPEKGLGMGRTGSTISNAAKAITAAGCREAPVCDQMGIRPRCARSCRAPSTSRALGDICPAFRGR